MPAGDFPLWHFSWHPSFRHPAYPHLHDYQFNTPGWQDAGIMPVESFKMDFAALARHSATIPEPADDSPLAVGPAPPGDEGEGSGTLRAENDDVRDAERSVRPDESLDGRPHGGQ